MAYKKLTLKEHWAALPEELSYVEQLAHRLRVMCMDKSAVNLVHDREDMKKW